MAKLITQSAFTPVVGKCYELHFGIVSIDGVSGFCTAKVRIDGIAPSQWIDLDTSAPLDPRISVYVVQAFSEISCMLGET